MDMTIPPHKIIMKKNRDLEQDSKNLTEIQKKRGKNLPLSYPYPGSF